MKIPGSSIPFFCLIYIALLSYLNRCKEPFRITTICILTQVLYVTAKHLDLYQVLAPNAYSYKEEFIPVIKRAVQSQVHEVGGENELCLKKRDISSVWLVTFKCTCIIIKWAASWQNKQNDCAPSKDSYQSGHLPSLISLRCASLGSWGSKLSSCGQWRLSLDWADTQADLSLHWAHIPFCWFCHEAAH